MIRRALAILLIMASAVAAEAQIPKKSIEWDKHSLIFDGKRVVPVMGEVHYSRIPADEWRTEVRKMKDGGVTILAAYVFWNHVEEVEGVFNWSGQRNLRAFLEICKEEEMPVVLRLGPFCHGEVRQGGIPDWMFTKGCKMRDTNKTFLHHTTLLYRQIYSQVQGLQWKDGGPVIAAQFDNEYRGRGTYLTTLKQIAIDAGFDLPFYTRTGWPELATPVPFGELLPLYGDYADGFWDRETGEAVGNYYKAFNFKAFRSSTAIATEQLGEQKEKLSEGDGQYPYFTCELGGGMMTSYHRRIYAYPEDSYSMAIVKLGSGSNLLGYYMYHGGTNPVGFMPGSNHDGSNIYLNENQRTAATNYNDLPVKTYDFQAPLGEFGQRNPHYYSLRTLHLFMKDYAETLAPMEATYPCPQDLPKGDDSSLRWSYRGTRDSAFVFVNNYERLQNLSAKSGVRFDVDGVVFPSKPITIPAGTACIFPVNIDGIDYATAQIVARRDGRIYMQQVEGIPTEISIGGKVKKNLKPKGLGQPVYGNVYLVDAETAGRLFLDDADYRSKFGPAADVSITQTAEAGKTRDITIGVQKVAEEPTDADFASAAVFSIDGLPAVEDRSGALLTIDYVGDCARLYADGVLVADNFYNGRPFLYGLWRMSEGCQKLELRVLPLQEDMPVYFPREAKTGEAGTGMPTARVVALP